jgi:hypothetical protein
MKRNLESLESGHIQTLFPLQEKCNFSSYRILFNATKAPFLEDDLNLSCASLHIKLMSALTFGFLWLDSYNGIGSNCAT